MKNVKLLKLSTVLMLLLSMPITGCAESGNRDQKGKQGPPPEAIEACEGKQEGDSVTFTGRQGENLNATCKSKDGMLAAVPEGHKER